MNRTIVLLAIVITAVIGSGLVASGVLAAVTNAGSAFSRPNSSAPIHWRQGPGNATRPHWPGNLTRVHPMVPRVFSLGMIVSPILNIAIVIGVLWLVWKFGKLLDAYAEKTRAKPTT